ncbi:P2X purinoceptor 7-like [Pecten maximus]|uniref:P2X purinoceptor 7-like n=1 Tax=Pecten maximus TaxID=6579 RepID=UPI0014582905|nr:P2X purinoceptor 7-like [Pecten maximus]
METDPSENDIEFTVAPYQFEPISVSTGAESEDITSEEENESDSADSNEVQDLHVDQWCDCGHCGQMPTNLECRCCCSFNLCQEKMEQGNLTCITEHEAFQVNCLNRHVLELAFYEHLDNNGPIGDEEPVHELYRYIAYRRFVRWVWHRLGRKQRKVLPSCVVLKIRKTFPSEDYTGFKYPRDY